MTGQELFQLLTISTFILTIILFNVKKFDIDFFGDEAKSVFISILFVISGVGTIINIVFFFADNWYKTIV